MADFDKFDYILVMDRNNLRDVSAQARTHHDRQKISLLLGEDTVPDPYYDDAQFAPVFKLIDQGCKDL